MIKDMERQGFTIVELIIVITIMAILIVLGTANLRGSTGKADDTERKSDSEAIAMYLETFYTSGAGGDTSTGYYPSINDLLGVTYSGSSVSCVFNSTVAMLRDINRKVLQSPGNDGSTTCSLVNATNSTQTAAGVTPQPTTSTYVYQPILNNGTLCTDSGAQCRKFNIYYKIDSDGLTYKLTSKNQ